ncbi:MAG TPA: 50S ribosomal protein L21 [Acidimicrobiales bacterium]|nr:50S ribosomal protein L21 [Acidimicrobiales bacterium]
MYAVIKTGGKQERVSEGQRVQVELLGGQEGDEISFTPVLLVEDGQVTADNGLTGATVSARLVGEAAGPKIRGFTYKNKSRSRRRWGHRQHYSVVEITNITKGEA